MNKNRDVYVKKVELNELPRIGVYRPPKVRPKILTIGGRYFYG